MDITLKLWNTPTTREAATVRSVDMVEIVFGDLSEPGEEIHLTATPDGLIADRTIAGKIVGTRCYDAYHLLDADG